MKSVERAYYLTGHQLLLLLSLVDDRPLKGFLPAGMADADVNAWKQTALSLVQGGLLVYGQSAPVIDAQLETLLRAMKDSPRQIALYCKERMPKILYSGASLTLMQEGGYRLSTQEPLSLQLLNEELLLPESFAEGEIAAVLETEDDETRALCEYWQENAPMPDRSVVEWLTLPQMRCAADVGHPDGSVSRWAWIDDPEAGLLLLRRTMNDCRVYLDTAQRREMLLREWEGQDVTG